MSLRQDIQQSVLDNYIELYDIDLSALGGATFFFTSNAYGTTPVTWRGNTYVPLPIIAENFEVSVDAAPGRPTLRVSNVSKILMLAVINQKDCVGGQVTRWRTYKKYLDGEPGADPNQYHPPDIYFISQKIRHTNTELAFTLVSPLDRPGIQIPFAQMLRDGAHGQPAFPGLARARLVR